MDITKLTTLILEEFCFVKDEKTSLLNYLQSNCLSFLSLISNKVSFASEFSSNLNVKIGISTYANEIFHAKMGCTHQISKQKNPNC
jgi:hypothetical protein